MRLFFFTLEQIKNNCLYSVPKTSLFQKYHATGRRENTFPVHPFVYFIEFRPSEFDHHNTIEEVV